MRIYVTELFVIFYFVLVLIGLSSVKKNCHKNLLLHKMDALSDAFFILCKLPIKELP